MIVASVSCIYGLGSPSEYEEQLVHRARRARSTRASELLRALVDIQYRRNDMVLGRGRFRARGDVVEVQPAYSETAYRVSLFGDEVESITHFDPLSGEVYAREDEITIYPATHYVTTPPTIERAHRGDPRGARAGGSRSSRSEGKLLEAHRLRQRTEYDLEMMQRARLLQRHRELLARCSTAARPGRRRSRCSTTSRATSS